MNDIWSSLLCHSRNGLPRGNEIIEAPVPTLVNHPWLIVSKGDGSVFLDQCSDSEIAIKDKIPSHTLPVETSTPLPPKAMNEEIIIERLLVLLDRKLSQHRNYILTEMKAIVSINSQDLKSNPKEEIDELLGEMHDLQNECGNLKS